MRHPSLKPFAVALAIMGFATLATAQYVWLDENGSKQFSDMPPPSSVPKNRILKAPGARPATAGDAASISGAGNRPGSSEAPAPLTNAEKNAAFLKRKQEQEKKNAKAAEEEQMAAEKAKNCERYRAQQQVLSSGQRIMRVDKTGERVYLTEEQRSQELQEVKSGLEKCK
jgi:hypothetical protein